MMVVQVPKYVLLAALAAMAFCWFILGRLIEDGRRWGMKTRGMRIARSAAVLLMALALAVWIIRG